MPRVGAGCAWASLVDQQPPQLGQGAAERLRRRSRAARNREPVLEQRVRRHKHQHLRRVGLTSCITHRRRLCQAAHVTDAAASAPTHAHLLRGSFALRAHGHRAAPAHAFDSSVPPRRHEPRAALQVHTAHWHAGELARGGAGRVQGHSWVDSASHPREGLGRSRTRVPRLNAAGGRGS